MVSMLDKASPIRKKEKYQTYIMTFLQSLQILVTAHYLAVAYIAIKLY